MVTKTTDDPEPVAATSSKSEERGDNCAAEVEVEEAAAEEVSRQELKIKPLDTPAADNNADKLEAKKTELKSPTESGNSTTKSIQRPTPRPAMMSPPATGGASTKAVATPSSSTPKVPTKSATRQRKPLPNITDQSLADPTVIAGVNSIIALLQSYGPLSYEQLKFNMATQLVPTNQVVQSDTTTKDRLQQVLGILVELGIIHEVDKKSLGKGGCLITKATAKKLLKDKEEAKEKEGEISKSETESTDQHDLNPVYCFGNGIPRMDVVLPSQILSEIKQSGDEVLRMQKRIEILRNALRDVDAMSLKEKGEAATSEGDTASTSVSKTKTPSYDKAKEVLKQLHELHPEIVQDPVYAAALRMFKLKEGIPGLNEEDEERTLQNMHGSGGGKLGKRVSASSLASSGDGSGKKKRKKGRPRKNSEPALKANATWS